MNDAPDPIVIVGAGVAGLRAAVELQEYADHLLVLEQTDRAGGRVKTDRTDGFLLDRGFQIFLTAYPESQSLFDYGKLNLHPFMDGALVRWQNDVHELVDPTSHPDYAIRTMMSDLGTWEDRWLSWKLRRQLRNRDAEDVGPASDRTTLSFLRDFGFSDEYISAFLKPFFAGVFLENDLRTQASFFRFLYQMFAEGKGTLPEQGMQAVPEQLVNRLQDTELRFNTEVEDVRQDQVTLRDGETIDAEAVVLAVDGWSASDINGSGDRPANGTSCYYFSMQEPPMDRPLIMLNGDGDSPVTNLCVPSLVCSNYSPPNRHLLSVSTVHNGGDYPSIEEVCELLTDWFGDEVQDWQPLETYHISRALPRAYPEDTTIQNQDSRAENGVYLAGDYRASPSLNGALASGRKAARQLINDHGSHAVQESPGGGLPE